MTALAKLIRARFFSKSLPAELVEAGKLPGTTFPAAAGARARFPRPTRTGTGLPASDLIVDLSRISISSIACAEFLPPAGYADIGAVANMAPRAQAITYADVPPSDLGPHYATLRKLRASGEAAISATDGSTGHRTY